MSSEKTPNLGLHKWAAPDYVQRTEFNDNFAKIDDHAKQVTEQLSETMNYLSEFGLNLIANGVVGDGVVDDTVKIQECINFVSNNGGGIVYAPKPPIDYLISNSITVPSNVTFQGAGKDISIFRMTLPNKHGFLVRGQHHVTIKDIQIKNISRTNAYEYHGIRVDGGSKNVTIEKCKIDNSDDTGISLGFDLTLQIGVEDCKVIDNEISNVIGGSGMELSRSKNCVVSGNIIKNCLQHGIRINGSKNIICTENTCESNSESGIDVQGYHDNIGGVMTLSGRLESLTVSNNICKNNKRGIYIQSGVRNVSLSSNILENNNRGIEFSGGDTSTIENVIVNGNTMFGHTEMALIISTTIDCKVINNTLKNGNRGIDIRGASTRLTIANNDIFDFGSPDIYGYGLSISSSNKKHDKLIIKDNRFKSETMNVDSGIGISIGSNTTTADSTISIRFNDITLRRTTNTFISIQGLGTITRNFNGVETNEFTMIA